MRQPGSIRIWGAAAAGGTWKQCACRGGCCWHWTWWTCFGWYLFVGEEEEDMMDFFCWCIFNLTTSPAAACSKSHASLRFASTGVVGGEETCDDIREEPLELAVLLLVADCGHCNKLPLDQLDGGEDSAACHRLTAILKRQVFFFPEKDRFKGNEGKHTCFFRTREEHKSEEKEIAYLVRFSAQTVVSFFPINTTGTVKDAVVVVVCGGGTIEHSLRNMLGESCQKELIVLLVVFGVFCGVVRRGRERWRTRHHIWPRRSTGASVPPYTGRRKRPICNPSLLLLRLLYMNQSFSLFLNKNKTSRHWRWWWSGCLGADSVLLPNVGADDAVHSRYFECHRRPFWLQNTKIETSRRRKDSPQQ